MHTKFTPLTPELYGYLASHCSPVEDLLLRLIEETEQATGAASLMQIAPDQGQFMSILAKLCGARHAVEVGTFTGYIALCLAKALPADGTLLCCDISEEWTSIARTYWAEAGVDDKIALELAPAIDTLKALPAERRFDIDVSSHQHHHRSLRVREWSRLSACAVGRDNDGEASRPSRRYLPPPRPAPALQ